MSPRKQTIKTLQSAGWAFHRHGTNHDIYVNTELKSRIPVPRHNFGKSTTRYILGEMKNAIKEQNR